MTTRRRFGPAEREVMERGRFLRVDLDAPIAWEGTAVRSVLVGRVGGAWRAYANVCMHRAIPLDFGADSAMTDDGRLLLCHQHGALYRPEDGLCVGGPCLGAKLVAVRVEEGAEGDVVIAGG